MKWRHLTVRVCRHSSARAVFTKCEQHLPCVLGDGARQRNAIQLTHCLTRDTCRHLHQRHDDLAAAPRRCERMQSAPAIFC